MSWRLSADALDYSPYEGRTLLVLISLASWADDDGSHIYPRIDNLAKKARCSIRQAQRALRQLEKDTVLVVVKKGGGRSVTEYRINVTKLRENEGCQNVTGDIEDKKNAENVTPEVTKLARHIETLPVTRSSTRSFSPPAVAGESEAVISLRNKEADRFPDFRDTIAQEWPDGFPAGNLGSAVNAFERATRTTPAETIIGAARLHGAWLKGQKAKRGTGPFYQPNPSTWLKNRGWLGYESETEQQAERGAQIATGLEAIIETLGPGVVENMRRSGVTDDELLRMDGVTFSEGPPPAFSTIRPFQASRLRAHGPKLQTVFGTGLQILEGKAVRSA